MNLLFIYNNLSELKSIEQNLSSLNHKIYVVRNLQEAITTLSRIKIDIIFCDLLSERIDGIQILRKIKSSGSFSLIPLVLVSSSLTDEEDISFFRRLGALGIIEKPLTIKSIQSILENRLPNQELGFEYSQHKMISDEEFIEEYTNILIRRIQKRVKAIESDQIFIHNLINSIPSAIFLIDKNFHIVDANEAGMKHIGINDKDEIKNKFCYSLLYKSNKVCNFEGHRCPILGVIQEKISTDHYLKFELGNDLRHYHIHFSPVLNPQNNSILMLENIVDNSNIVEIINKSKENEFKLETILNESRYGILLIEKEKIVTINQATRTLLNLKEDSINELIKSIGEEIYQEMVIATNQNIIFRKELIGSENLNNKIITLEAQKINSLDREFIFIILYDYTENYNLIQSLRDKELLFRTIINNVQDVFILINNNNIVEINNQIERITNRRRESYLKQNLFSSLNFINESHLFDITPKELTVTTGENKTLILLLRIYNLLLKNQKHTLLQLTDITEERERERIEISRREKIQYFDRLEIAAKMNKGIAHSINNFLSGINNFADYLTKPDINTENIKVTANIIKKLTKNASSVISRILKLLSKGDEEFTQIDISYLIDELLDIIKYAFPRNIEVRAEINSTDNMIRGDFNAILQSLINIVINSREAMPNGGSITISTDNIQTMDSSGEEKRYIQIKISDTGKGIPEEVRDKIFTPYFSSKIEPGSGLGLSVVYNTILNHNGTIRFKSEINKGTTFIINLPVSSEKTDEHKPIPSGRREKILIISENSLEREIIKRLLIKNNYDAYTAIDSIDALESLKVTMPELVIIDSNLSRISKEETYEKIIEIYPDINIILYTGLVLDEGTMNLIMKGLKAIIYKPLDIRELLQTLQSVLRKDDERIVNTTPDSKKEIKKILIIDDEEFILSALKMNLSDKYDIQIETSGAKALDRIINNEIYDRYIIDINMPDLNGIEFYKMLRELNPDISKKVIFITGGISDEKLNSELQAIKDDISLLDKPFDIDELIRLLS
ncbi:MAG: response regulator [Myxococcota bacterium]